MKALRYDPVGPGRKKPVLLQLAAIEAIHVDSMTVTMVSGATHDLSGSVEQFHQLLAELGYDAEGKPRQPWIAS
jgi:hypothetical protein